MENLTIEKIYRFLKEINSLFPVPLNEKVDLCQYTRKLIGNATICYQEDDNRIIAAVFGYTDNLINNMAYISIVACLKDFQHTGLSKKNLLEFIKICQRKHIDAIHLYAVRDNIAAVSFYLSNGFVPYKPEYEPRPNDLHLILYLI